MVEGHGPAARRSGEISATLYDWLLLGPAVVLLCALTLFPILYNVVLSLYRKHAYLPQAKFIGITNYIDLYRDPEFYSSFWNGALYASASIALQVLSGTAGAILVNERFKGRDLVRGVLLFPYLIPTVVVVILWKWLLSASHGLMNYVGMSLGLMSAPVVWFSRPWIMFTLVMVSTWQFFPFVLVSVLARLQTIPEELYRAAHVDNASPWATFLHITLPALRNVLITIILLRSVWMFTKFDTVWLLAGREGVGKYIQTLPVYTYRVTFEYLQAGMGAAISILLLLFLLGASIAYLAAMLPDRGRP